MSKIGRTPYQGKATNQQHQTLIRVLVFQLLLMLVTLALLYVSVGWVAAYSGLLGGLIYLIPNGYQLRRIIAPDNSNNIGHALRGMYKSEIWKMALTAVLFAVAFALVKPVEPFSLFGVFVLLQLTAVVMTVVNQSKHRRR